MIECEWCRAPNPEGSRVCVQCDGALPPGLPVERPALLSRRDRLHLGTVRGHGSTVLLAGEGHTLLVGGPCPAESDDDPAAPSQKLPNSRATQSGAPYALRRPEVNADASAPQGRTVVGIPRSRSPLLARPPLPKEPPDGENVALSVRGALRTGPAHARKRSRTLFRVYASTLTVAGLILGAGVIGGLLAIAIPKPRLKVADFHVATSGRDRLTVRCKQCPEQASLRWQGQTVPLVAGRATFEAPSQLPVGLSRLNFELLQPGSSPKTLPLALSVSFRVGVDTDGLADWPPRATITLDAPPGAEVLVSSSMATAKPGPTDYQVSLVRETAGQAARPLPLQRDFPIRVTVGADERQTVARIRSTIVPLTFKALPRALAAQRPVRGPHPPNDDTRLVVRGNTLPGATVSLRRRLDPETARPLLEATADERGSFALPLRGFRTEELVIVSRHRDFTLRWAPVFD